MAASAAKSPGNLAQAALVGAVLVGLSAVLAGGYFVFVKREMAVLYQDLRPADAAAVVAELKAQNVDYEIKDGGTRILVPAAGIDAVRLDVAASELPVKGLDGFELFDDTDMGLTDFAQKIKYQRAIQGELARTIMRMDGVKEARVHISIPERSVFRSEQSEAKAAVALVTRAAEFETPERIEGIQELVASAIADLSTSDVVVINEHGKVISPKVVSPVADVAPVRPAAAPANAETMAREARLADALGRAFPGRSFEVSLSTVPVPVPAQATSPETLSTADVPPAIVVNVATAPVLTPTEQERVRSEMIAVDADLAPKTEVRFALTQPARVLETPAAIPFPAASSMAPASAARPQQAETPTAGFFPQLAASPFLWIGVGSVVLVLILGGVLWRVVQSRPALSAEDQRRFADNLKLGLQPGAQELVDEA